MAHKMLRVNSLCAVPADLHIRFELLPTVQIIPACIWHRTFDIVQTSEAYNTTIKA